MLGFFALLGLLLGKIRDPGVNEDDDDNDDGLLGLLGLLGSLCLLGLLGLLGLLSKEGVPVTVAVAVRALLKRA